MPEPLNGAPSDGGVAAAAAIDVPDPEGRVVAGLGEGLICGMCGHIGAQYIGAWAPTGTITGTIIGIMRVPPATE